MGIIVQEGDYVQSCALRLLKVMLRSEIFWSGLREITRVRVQSFWVGVQDDSGCGV